MSAHRLPKCCKTATLRRVRKFLRAQAASDFWVQPALMCTALVALALSFGLKHASAEKSENLSAPLTRCEEPAPHREIAQDETKTLPELCPGHVAWADPRGTDLALKGST